MNRKELFKVIDGGLPSEKQMRRELPSQFKELNEKLEKVKKYQWQVLEDIRHGVEAYCRKYGNNLEDIYLIPDKDLKVLYNKLNKIWLPNVSIAIQMQANEKRKIREERNIGIEPGE